MRSEGRATPQAPSGFRGAERLAQKAAVVFGGNVAGAMLGYAALLAIGRYYLPGAYGAYVFAVSLVGVVNTVFLVGFNQAHTREIARGVPTVEALGVYVRIRLALNAVKVLLMLVALAMWFQVLGKGFTDATSLEVVLIVLASSILVSIRKIASDTWNGQGRVYRTEWANLLDSTVYAATVVLIGLGLASASGRWSPLPWLGDSVAQGLGLPAAAGPLVLAKYVALGHFLGKVAGISLTGYWWLCDKTEVGPWNPKLAAEYRRFALPVALISILVLLLQHMDVLMLGFFWTTREVGWYGAAQRLANVALLASIALRGLLMPFFANLFGRGEGERAMRAFRQVERFLLMIVVPLSVAIIVWAREGLHIFVGDPFLGAAPALQWLAAWTFISAMNMPLRAKHMGAGSTRVLLGAAFLNVGLNLVLNLILIPRSLFGIPLAGMAHEGAALATFCSSLVAYSWSRVAANRLYKIAVLDSAQLRMAVAAVAPAAAWLWMRWALPGTAYDRVWELVAIGLIGGVLYVVVLWAVKGVRGDDIRLLRRVLHPQEIVREARGKS